MRYADAPGLAVVPAPQSFLRHSHSRESGNPFRKANELPADWIPAFAGMTVVSGAAPLRDLDTSSSLVGGGIW